MRSAAFTAFFLSGASSLIFQSIWSRMLSHVFGATGIAISTVVTIFMAGLGLGAWLAGRYTDRIKHPIFTYGVAELLVGLWGLLVPFLVNPEGWLATVNSWLRVEVGADSAGFMIARFFCVLPILLVPTTLMGASLPLLARHFVRLRDDASGVSSWVGVLYSVNTFGAVAGVFLASFVLLPTVGLEVTNAVAVGFNILLFVGIFLLRGKLLGSGWKKGDRIEWLPAPKIAVSASVTVDADGAQPAEGESKSPLDGEPAPAADAPSPPKPEPPPDPEGDVEPVLPREEEALPPIPAFARKAAFLSFAVSGAAALCYEVVWSRALSMTIGSSVYSFGLILETFLVGIAGGSALAAAILASRRRILPMTAIASCVLILLANAMCAAREDVISWLAISAVFMVPIVIIWVFHARQRNAGWANTPADPTMPALFMLLMPMAAALFNAVKYTEDDAIGQMPLIIAAVTGTICIFLLLLIVFRRFPVLQLAIIQLFIAGATFINFLFQDDIPCAFAQLVSTIDPRTLPDHVGTIQIFMFLTAGLCTLPATMGMGAMFPLTLRLWTSGGSNVGRDVGTVYAGNTLGSIVGAWLPGFILMPILGLQWTIAVGIVVNLAMALLMFIASASSTDDEPSDSTQLRALDEDEDEDDERGGRGWTRVGADGRVWRAPGWYAASVYILAPLIPALVAVLYLGLSPNSTLGLQWNNSQMTLGVFRMSIAEDACSPEWGTADLAYYGDGLATTVTVERWGQHFALKNNGKVDASNGDDMPTQIVVGAYPLLFSERPFDELDVAVIGWGSGVTVGTTLKFPVRSVRAIELERRIMEASWWFQDVNGLDYTLDGAPNGRNDVGEFPYVEMDRLEIINDDGRNYLASTDQQFDVIISEPSNPWITGVSDLFTTDHFRITKRRLREGGIYCQWVQLYEMSPANIKVIYRTFASQFDHVLVLAADDLSSDTILLGSDSPILLDLEHLQERFQAPGVESEMVRARIYNAFDIFSRILFIDRDEVNEFAQIEYRRRGGEWVAFPETDNGPEDQCEDDCRREPSTLNTDDNAHIEFAAPRDLIGFSEYEGYVGRFYSVEWPWGRLRGHLEGFGEGEDASRNYGELALSLLGHGRKVEAAGFIAEAYELGRAREALVAFRVFEMLSNDELEPRLSFQAPTPGRQLAAEERLELQEGFREIRHNMRRGDMRAALRSMEDMRSPIRLHSGPGMRFLYGYLLYKAGTDQRDAVDHLEDLIRSDDSYVRQHPEAYYFLARAQDAMGDFDKSVRNMRTYVEYLLVPFAGAQEIPEPPPEEAPVSDREGEGEKLEHRWRGDE